MPPLYEELSDEELNEHLKIHRRRHAMLAEQVANFGKMHAPVDKLIELDDEQTSIKAIQAELKRRKVQPPSEKSYEEMSTDELREKLEYHQRNVAILSKFLADLGEFHLPIHTLKDLDAQQRSIAAILDEFTQRGQPAVVGKTEWSGGPRLQPSQNIRGDLLLARALVRRGDNQQRAWSTLQSIMLADASRGEAWHLISQLLDDPAQRAEALERAARHGYGGSKKRNVSDAIMWLLCSLAMLLGGALVSIYWLEASRRGRVTGGMNGMAGAGLLVFGCMAFYFLSNFQQDWTRDRQAARRAQGRGYRVMLAGILGMVLFTLLSAAWIYQRSILGLPIPADSLTNLLLIGVFAFALSVIVGPLALVEIAPELALSRGLARFFDGGVVLVAVILAGLALIGRPVLPWWALVGAAVVGLSLIGIAVISYRRGDSFFDAMLDLTGSNISKPPRRQGGDPKE